MNNPKRIDWRLLIKEFKSEQFLTKNVSIYCQSFEFFPRYNGITISNTTFFIVWRPDKSNKEEWKKAIMILNELLWSDKHVVKYNLEVDHNYDEIIEKRKNLDCKIEVDLVFGAHENF